MMVLLEIIIEKKTFNPSENYKMALGGTGVDGMVLIYWYLGKRYRESVTMDLINVINSR